MKKGILLSLVLAALMALSLLGLTLMTQRLEADRVDQAVYVTATPAPVDDDNYLPVL